MNKGKNLTEKKSNIPEENEDQRKAAGGEM